MRKFLAVLITALAVMLVPTAAHAAVKFHSLNVTDEGTQLRVTGNVSGLGNEDLTAIVNATGIATVECSNPAGNVAPGQDTSVDVSGSQDDIQVKNGRATFNVLTDAPTVSGAEACPNPKWTATVTDVEFTDATLTLIQGGQVISTTDLI
ncbi:MAG: hypothetical protein K0Q93_919 [Nocardioidaceae bacterium]|jgi:hypothetical protein|nr:hypothetical protein [Nocardioidaceae bacterium]